MKKKIALSLLIGVAVSALALYFALKNVPFGKLKNYLAAIDYLWLIPATAIGFISFGLRVCRWQIILASSRKIGFWQAFHPMMIGFMINCILPGRVGEIARPAILKKNEQVPFSTGLATVAAERTLDLCILIALFAMVLGTIEIDPDFSMKFGSIQLSREILEKVAAGMAKLCIVLIGAIALLSFNPSRQWFNRIILWMPNLFFSVGPKGKAKLQYVSGFLATLIDNFASGFALIKNPVKLLSCVLLTVAVWSSAALSYFVFSLGCPGIHLTFSEAFAVMVIICFFVALPSVPGYWGIWEAGGVFALALFGIYSDEAAGFTLANHAIQIIPVIIVGLVSAWITSVNIVQVSYQPH